MIMNFDFFIYNFPLYLHILSVDFPFGKLWTRFFSQKKETPNDNNLTKIYHFERVCVACVDVKMCVVMEYFTKFTI